MTFEGKYLLKLKIDLEKLQNKPILDENADKTNRPKELTLAEKIYKENKVKFDHETLNALKIYVLIQSFEYLRKKPKSRTVKY